MKHITTLIALALTLGTLVPLAAQTKMTAKEKRTQTRQERKIAQQKFEIFKPSIDIRYSEEEIVSHDSNSIQSTPVDSSASILLLSSGVDVVGIDEAQFFDQGIVDICNQLADQGTRVIVAGLDMDFKKVPFGPMPYLLSIADEVTKVHAICVECGHLANYSHRLIDNDKRVLLGEKGEYQPLCRTCYNKKHASQE